MFLILGKKNGRDVKANKISVHCTIRSHCAEHIVSLLPVVEAEAVEYHLRSVIANKVANQSRPMVKSLAHRGWRYDWNQKNPAVRQSLTRLIEDSAHREWKNCNQLYSATFSCYTKLILSACYYVSELTGPDEYGADSIVARLLESAVGSCHFITMSSSANGSRDRPRLWIEPFGSVSGEMANASSITFNTNTNKPKEERIITGFVAVRDTWHFRLTVVIIYDMQTFAFILASVFFPGT